MTDPNASPWPREIPGLGRLRILAFAPCADCQAEGKRDPLHTWAHYGQTPLCPLHVRARLAGRAPAVAVRAEPDW